MAIALQWHTVSNTSGPIALAVPLSAEALDGGVSVLFVVGGAANAQAYTAEHASAVAAAVAESYQATIAPIPADALDVVTVGQALATAITCAVSAQGQPPTAGMGALAAAIHGDQLVTARYRSGAIYLLRGGMVQELLDASFIAQADVGDDEPVVGQLDLQSQDRLFLCSDDAQRVLPAQLVARTLETLASSRRAAQALLAAARRSRPTGAHGVIVADYVAGRATRRSEEGRSASALRRRRVRIAATIAIVAALLGTILLGAYALTHAMAGPVRPVATAAPAPPAGATP